MVRPESCTKLTGASPVAVSTEAPRSRPRAREEILPPEWGVESPHCIVRCSGGEQVRRPSHTRTLQPREIRTRKGGPAEPLMSRRRQQTALDFGSAQDARGVWRRACGHSLVRNRRDPSRRLTFSEGGPYKPTAKGERAGRESEGLVVPLTPVTKGRPREGALLWSWRREEVSVRAWSQDPTTPWATTTAKAMPPPKCENSSGRLYTGAKRPRRCRRNVLFPSGRVTTGRRRETMSTAEVCMPGVKTIGKPYAGNPHVRFERGPQETERARHRA